MEELNNKKTIRAWSFYDWANSAYPLVISTAIFPLYYASLTSSRENGILNDTVYFMGMAFKNTEFYSYTISVSYLIVSMISPLLSGVADYTGNKMLFLKIFCYTGAISCFGLFFFDVQHYEVSMLLVLLASVGFWASIVFYNSYLPDIASEDQYDKISARGYAMGYLGSSILLTSILYFVLTYNMNPKWSFVIVAIWWAGFAQITYYYLPKQSRTRGSSLKKLFKGFHELKRVFVETRKNYGLKLFLWSFFIYSMGVQTVMVMATFFGEKEVIWSSPEEKTGGLITSMLLIQIIAIGGAFLHSYVSKHIGNKKTLCISLGLWVLVCVAAYFIKYPIHFYLVAALVGVIMGGIQSLSRSSYSKLISETKETTSYFSFYDVSEKIGLVIGTFCFGFLERLTGSMRGSIILISVFFFVGLIIMYFVPSRSFSDESTKAKV
jgi:UMF1 family MFS transporter